jgi:hypothetical protein
MFHFGTNHSAVAFFAIVYGVTERPSLPVEEVDNALVLWSPVTLDLDYKLYPEIPELA